MVLKVDNKGAKDLMNNWSVGGRTRHIEVKQYFIRDLKEAGIIKLTPGDELVTTPLGQVTSGIRVSVVGADSRGGGQMRPGERPSEERMARGRNETGGTQ